MKELLQKDIVWRPLVIVLTLLFSFGAIQAINKSNQTSLVQPLEIMARAASWEAQRWLDAQYEKAIDLASDPRLVEAFESNNWEASILLVRRALYEFSYLNDYKNVYAFNENREPALVRTANAPIIPHGVFTVMRQTHTAETDADSLLVNAAGEPSLLVLHTVRNKEQIRVGYIAYLVDIKSALASFDARGITQVLDAKLAIVRDRGDNRLVMVEDTLNSIARLSVFAPSQTDVPILNEPSADGSYTHNGTQVMAASVPVASQNGWYALTYVDENLIMQQSAIWKNAIRAIASFIILVMIIVPGRGPYGRALKKLGRAAKPKSLIKIAQGKHIDHDPVTTINTAITSAFDERGAKMLGESFAPKPGAGTIQKGKLPELPEAEKKKLEEKLSSDKDNDKDKKKEEKPENEALKAAKEDEKIIGEKNKDLFFSKTRKAEEKELTDNIMVYIIRCCIRDERIKLVYQPVYDSVTKQIVMYEVLLRLIDEDGDILPPAKFMPVAEKNGLMPELDECVISVVLKKHFKEGIVPPPAPLSINLSGNTFESISYLQKLMNSSLDFHVEPGALVYELRSDEIVSDSRAMDFIRECRDLGFRFSIDYFGGGTKTVQAARSLKFDYMKVNAFRYKELAANKNQQKEILRLAHAANRTGLTLIMERIESNLMSKFCSKVGVNGLQGYFFSEPVDRFLTDEDHGAFSVIEAPGAKQEKNEEKPEEAVKAAESMEAETSEKEPKAAQG